MYIDFEVLFERFRSFGSGVWEFGFLINFFSDFDVVGRVLFVG